MQRNKHGDVTDKRFEFYKGRKHMYSKVERGEFVGYTVILKTPHQSSYVNFNNYNEAWNTIINHCANYDKIAAVDNIRANYFTSDEGKWARQDSFA
jgi:hypothetical protein